MSTLPPELALRIARTIDELAPRTLYGIARLRQEVFVVEQDCAYLDLDGRDLDPGTIQLWAENAGGGIAATVRVLDADERDLAVARHVARPGLRSIGRVVTAPHWRGRGVAAALVARAIEICAGDPILIHAQAHLEDWYGRFGFVTCGDGFLEDGIPHLPMLHA